MAKRVISRCRGTMCLCRLQDWKHGLSRISTEWCYVSYTGVGIKSDDAKLSQWHEGPLGRIARLVLSVMHAACTRFSRRVDEREEGNPGIGLSFDISDPSALSSASRYPGLRRHGKDIRNRDVRRVGVQG